ncbi:acyltransferase family protein [Bradyrhizobium sp.]|uniref:acyltransferase family protein n=1 Tax=Bradyrhizobium sp. TaxID=376 RepID=UPI001EBA5256|nr:acyltransferase [Bradyrhizobium sp.]MBV8920747.1 acyltransferase [Bradyrhizobium sp.]MBV9983521.1 acyltransferase [Bradyrhizobium sp.]
MKRELYGIQYLRGIASLSVLAYHLTLRAGGTPFLGTFRIDLFFVVSGFIMWVITVDRDIAPSTFMLRRVIRLVPSYWLATAATALLILAKPNFTYGHQLDSYRLVASLFFIPTLAGDDILPVVLQAWTLIYEMMFYLLIAASLRVEQRYRWQFIAATLCGLAVLHVLVPEAHLASVTNPNILLEFLAGVLVGVVWKRCDVPSGWALLFLVIGLLGFAQSEYFHPDMPPMLKFGIPSVFVVAGAVYYEKAKRVPNIRILSLLGEASYSIFLWHVWVSLILEGLLLHLHLPLRAQFMLELTGTVFISCLICIWVERPTTEYLRSLVTRPSLPLARGTPS